ncbi:MAG: alpha/beta hydrolase [Acidobacteriota bacterium]|nr:alpha/beta hydrolase [Acidobacteriota bacterium]
MTVSLTTKAIYYLGCSLALVSLVIIQSVTAQNLTFEDIKKLPAPPGAQRLAYGSDPSQFGELRLPQRKGPSPVVVVIHGGCWYSEYDLSQLANFNARLAGLGVATWSLEYRRIGNPGGAWPGTFEDVAHGTDYLRVLARSYPLDLRRVIVVGHSAGGQLALWLAARNRLPKDSPLYANNPLQLQGIVSLAGITDLRRYRPNCGEAVNKLLGGSPEEVPDRYRQTSPIELLPLKVEQRLIHGTLDELVPPDFSKDYEAAARKKRDRVQLILLPNAGHFDLIAPQSSAWPAVEKAVRSLLRLRKR